MSGNARPVLVRYNPDTDEFEMQCGRCRDLGQKSYWPIDTDFWAPRSSLQKCRACHNTERRLARRKAQDANAKQRAYYRANAARILAKRKARHAKNREAINAKRRAAYAAKKAAASPQLGLFDG